MTDGPAVGRPRRYLSVRAGSYPAPVTAQVPRATSAALGGALGEPARDRAAKAELFALPAPTESQATAWSLPPIDPQAAESGPQPLHLESMQERLGLRTLAGAVAGGVIGSIVAILLLALSDPAERLPLLTRPAELWNNVDDGWVRVSALVVAAGFVLLGGILARYRRSS